MYRMPHIDNPKLYEIAKQIADEKYKKPSAYKSGFIVKTYKELGGTYSDDNEPKNLKRWFKEDWKDIAGLDYPVYRPTKKVSNKTPLTPDEIDPQNLLNQSVLKQQFKGEKNLPPFQKKSQHNTKDMWGEIKGIGVKLLPYVILPYTKKQAKRLGVDVEPSLRPTKKIDVYDGEKLVASVGARGYMDYPTYWKEYGKEYADNKRRLYKIRHEKDRHKVGSPGWYADQLLW